MPPISLKGVVIGSVIDVGGSVLAGALFTMVYMVVLAARGVSESELEQRVLGDPSYYVATLVVGCGFLAVGAYVAARVARARELAHAGIVGLVAVATGLLFVGATETAAWPSWYLPVSFGLTLPVALLGGYVAKRRALRSRVEMRAT